MARNPLLANRDQNIVNDYLEGATVVELEHSYGVCSRMIYTILKNANVEVNARRITRALSPLHQHIARCLIERAFDFGHDRPRIADILGWSMQKVSKVMKGHHDLSVLDLQALETYLKVSYNDLMTPSAKARTGSNAG